MGGEASRRTLSEATAIYPDSETNVQNSLENTPKNFLGGKSHLCKEPQKTNVSFCPKSFTMAEDPKAIAVEQKTPPTPFNKDASEASLTSLGVGDAGAARAVLHQGVCSFCFVVRGVF